MLKIKAEQGYQAKITDAIKRIEDAITNINSNEEMAKYIKFQSKFHNYSFSNIILIYSQMPNAQYVCGYNGWLKLNRFVKKGEKAIKVLAPIIKKTLQEESDDMTKEEKDKGKKKIEIIGFKITNIFDLSQTNGDDTNLPVLIKGLSNQNINANTIYKKLLNVFDEVSITEITNIKGKGSFNKESLSIKIKSDLTETQKVKTLLHEFSHFLHHRDYFSDEPYSIGEIIAESSACIVSEYLGLDTSDYSIPYIQSWSGGDLSLIKSAGDKIQKIAHRIIKMIEESK